MQSFSMTTYLLKGINGTMKRFRCENRNLLRHRFISCATLGLYAFALIVLPVFHEHGCDHSVETCCDHSEPVPSDSDDSCPICEFAVLAVPFLAVPEPLLWQADAASEISLTLLILPVADVTDLPPCRAPPVA